VLEKRVSGQDAVVRLNNGGGDLRGRVDGETELGLLAVVDGETLKKKRTQTGTSTTTDGMEHKESLKTSAVVGELANAVESKIDDFLTDGVVTTGVVVGSIFLTGDQLFRVKELTVSSGSDFIDDGRLQIEEDATRDVLASTSLRKEGVERVVATTDGLVGRHLSIRLDTVLKAIKFPAAVAHLDTGLTEVKGKNFSHCCVWGVGVW
jgi:hypothetical protein